MATRLLQRMGTSLAVPAIVVGAFALTAPSHAHSASSDTKASAGLHIDSHNTELSADAWYLAHWDVDAGAEGYAHTVNYLRSIIDAHGGHRTNVPVGRRNYAVDTTPDASQDHGFIDLTVSTAGANVHLIIRVSDLYVVGFHYYVPGQGNRYVPLASHGLPQDLPQAILNPGHHGYIEWTNFVGHENYNDLARMAGTQLEDLTLSHQNLRQAVFDMRVNPQDTSPNAMRTKATGVLRMIAAISEGSRIRPLSADLSTELNRGGQTALRRYVELIRNWAGISRVFTNPGGAFNWVHTANWGDIRDRSQAAAVLLVALAARPVSGIKDEL
ncbi:ribosome-inactivating family protein [Streptomyces griseorubiginosus]|uniref:ribosome-inactivating family protein n=1 Tax=Streptomyces griseorubiginosus TaxID=67304 RepID=UPI001AD738C7|nr:ribosome-inactivating family protein [Streptomyces griseorubiginosus]MBO4255328.1 hypothetical protein [Streptomyces griseorubiginosus]